MATWDERRAARQALDAFVQEHQACGELTSQTLTDGRIEVRCPRCDARIAHFIEDVAPPPAT